MAIEIDLKDHPLHAVSALRRRYGGDIALSFARYRYFPRSRHEERASFSVPISDVNAYWLRRQLHTLEPDEELGLESRVCVGGVFKHIPMLDFRGMASGQLRAITTILPTKIKDIRIYFSGRSFHAYYLGLIDEQQWVRFMGSALLCNTPGREVIDQRWVGHRLIGGCSTLRWSSNTGRHRQYPTRISPRVLDLESYAKRTLLKKVAT